MMESNVDNCLLLVRDWARGKIDAGKEPPWAWYQYMKLVDAVDSIRRGRASVKRLAAGSRGSVRGSSPEQSGNRDASAEKGTERSRDDEPDPPLPM
jgi:hypothetical protein